MTSSDYHWNLPTPVPESINSNLDTFSPPFRSVLFRRGFMNSQDAVSFLLPQDPSFSEEVSLRHLELGCDLIKKTLEGKQAIAIFGDYDTDGITATALLTLALRKIGGQILPYIPNRFVDGYGLNMPAIDLLHEGGAKLLITVDNGIRSNDEVAYAKSLGMSVIITDHHLPLEIIPAADAIINPKVPGDPYPNKSLAGVGVVYKLICRLSSYYPSIKPEDYLDLVALGTIADIVSLEGENRYLVKQGLIQINQHRRQSLLSVIGAAGYLDQKIYATDISFQIAPRINSSGRLADVNHLVPLELLLSSDPAECGKHAQTLEIHNDRRKRMSRSMQKRIEEQFSPKDPLPPILISLDQDHDLGVAGITAGHLTRKYYLPAIVGAVGDETTTASCRSIPEFDISAALKSIKDLFTRFGGHKLAAGFTIENQNLPAFHEKMTLLAEKELSVLDLQPTLEIDSVVKLSDLNSTLYQELLKLEPTGEGNPMPVFVVRGITAKKVSKVGKFGDHLKFLADDGDNKIPAIAFSQGSSASALTGRFDLACKFTENVFRGKREFQLQVVDIKPQ